MPDSLTGYVTRILSEDTIELKISSMSAVNPDAYDEIETIHIDNIFEAESGSPVMDLQPFAVRTTEDLEARLKDRRVRCVVKERDEYGHLFSDVTIL